jgi:hypothetical protein
MRFVVSIDAEGDNQWLHGAPLTTQNVAFWQPFMDVCERYGVRPTYLVTSEIIEDPIAARLLSRWRAEHRIEVGAHLHPWSTPPFRDEPGLRGNDSAHTFPSELREELLHAKLATLTDQIETRVGLRPTSFRAGRFGFDTKCARVLTSLGYIVDSSVTPLMSWRQTPGMPGGPGGPDFRTLPVTPFLIAGASALLEVPVTIMYTDWWIRRYAWSQPLIRSRPWHAAQRRLRHRRGWPSPLWLRPVPGVRASDLARLWRVAEADGVETVVMMFHSSELMPGCSPYRPTRRSICALYALLEEFFDFVAKSGGTCSTLSEAARGILAGPSPPVLRL